MTEIGIPLVMSVGLFILSVASGMLGLGVAFAAVPFLALFLPDLVHHVQPLSLLLNGITALFSVVGFAKSGYIDWRRAIVLAVVTTLCAPLGSLLVEYVDPRFVWYLYLAAVGFLAFRLFCPSVPHLGNENFRLALLLAAPISILSGFLGVGPGFLLMPVLVMVGFDPKMAAGINAFAVTPPSFSALVPRMETAVFDLTLTGILLTVGALGSFWGARLTSRFLPGERIKQIFGVLIVVVTAYRIATL